MKNELSNKIDPVDVEKLIKRVINSSLKTSVKSQLIQYFKADHQNKLKTLQVLAYEFFNTNEAIEKATSIEDIDNWKKTIINTIVPTLQGYTQSQIDLVIALIIHEQAIRDEKYNNLFMRYMEIFEGKGGLI